MLVVSATVLNTRVSRPDHVLTVTCTILPLEFSTFTFSCYMLLILYTYSLTLLVPSGHPAGCDFNRLTLCNKIHLCCSILPNNLDILITLLENWLT